MITHNIFYSDSEYGTSGINITRYKDGVCISTADCIRSDHLIHVELNRNQILKLAKNILAQFGEKKHANKRG